MTLDGSWTAIIAELNGQNIDEEFLSFITLTISKDQCEIHLGGNTDKGSIKFVPYVVPMAFDFTCIEGTNKDKVIKDIYKISGGFLIVCFNVAGGERPKTFVSTAENKYSVVRYKRVE